MNDDAEVKSVFEVYKTSPRVQLASHLLVVFFFFGFPPCFFKNFNQKLITIRYGWIYSGVNR